MLYLAAPRNERLSRKDFNRAVPAPRLLIVKRIGYPPFGHDEANLFFNVVAERYERSVMLLMSDLPLADDQTLVIAMLDRLLHHTHIVQISDESADSRTSDEAAAHRPDQRQARQHGGGSEEILR